MEHNKKERTILVHDKEMVVSHVLDKIREYESTMCVAYELRDKFKYNDVFVLRGHSTTGFQNNKESISIPDDPELITSIIRLIGEHCAKELEIYKEALCYE